MRDEVQRYSLFEDIGILRAGFIHDFLPYFQTYEVPYISAHKTHFFPEKYDLNSICVLCAEGKYYFQTYKYPYIYYTTSLSWDTENNYEDDFSGSDVDFLGYYDK